MSDVRAVISSPIGKLLIASNGDAISEICFQRQIPAAEKNNNDASRRNASQCSVIRGAIEQLEAYFRGELQEFNLPLRPTGTDFQCRVWSELQAIQYGETANYGEIASRIGSPRAARAVGAANGRNPIPIIIPCHRVIGANGSLTGFGGGLKIKRALLELERQHK